ncbi:protein of unknown function (plasmid) [Thermococcus nautili]|uniref:hypothetical protein n=1 Tax=Thermococcus nautili TaxID=195522 RepID=UPI0025547EE5|nr:hypothetical protein [Thermococcus nautili]CAI1494178.1 protein of unknown function [Thermococcus nautili]
MWKVAFENDYIIVGESDSEFSPLPLEKVTTFDDLFKHYRLLIAHKDDRGKIKEFLGTHPSGYSVHFFASAEDTVPPALKRFLTALEGNYMQANPEVYSNVKITLSDGRKYWTVIVENARVGVLEGFIKTYEKEELEEDVNRLLNDIAPYFELMECIYRVKDKLGILEIRLR